MLLQRKSLYSYGHGIWTHLSFSYSDMQTTTALYLHLKMMLSQPEPSWSALIQVDYWSIFYTVSFSFTSINVSHDFSWPYDIIIIIIIIIVIVIVIVIVIIVCNTEFHCWWCHPAQVLVPSLEEGVGLIAGWARSRRNYAWLISALTCDSSSRDSWFNF